MNTNTSNTRLGNSSIITIGTFDGVHIGHQKIINRLVKTGKEKGLKSVVLTFFPHPRMVLQPDFKIQLLHTIEERQAVLKQFDLEGIVIKEFTKAFANLSAYDYVKTILVDELHAKHIIIGYDHHFGKNRTANITDLKAFGKQFDFTVEEISVEDIQDVAVSSTKIRTALLEGDVKTANLYLGYAYFLSGAVIKGKGIGKTIDFPTANISVEKEYKLIPKNGVYIIKAFIANKWIFGMMNIGNNPTFNEIKQSIEVHFFDFKNDLYHQTLKIEILQRLRDEHKFETVNLLQSQLKKDKINALAYIETQHD
ncbi:MAG: bifunctional riboflavin kinase/FAD synthetase [Psychroserpens sp.]|uniref:bifunctional riboflavin kinase/FAD synthetase n=1 Tax=Psychroserpens sp. TaxID=2020870 RepID=UPI003C7291D1